MAFISLHIECLALFASLYIYKSRRMRWVGRAACVGERRGVYRVLVGKSETEKPLGRWEDNINMDIQEVRWGHGLV